MDYLTGTLAGRLVSDRTLQVDELVGRCSTVLRRLVEGGCGVDATERTFGLTPVDMAVLLGDVESTALLVSVGADPGHLMKTFASSQLYDAVVATDRQQVGEAWRGGRRGTAWVGRSVASVCVSVCPLVTVAADPGHLMKTFASSQLYDAVVAVDRQQVKLPVRCSTLCATIIEI